MATELSAQEVRELLEEAATVWGTKTALAQQIGVTRAHLSNVMLGKVEPMGKIVEWLDLERVVVYRKQQR